VRAGKAAGASLHTLAVVERARSAQIPLTSYPSPPPPYTELNADKTPYEFASAVREVCPAGSLTGISAFKFSFARPDLPFENYTGVNGRVRYLLRAVVTKAGYGSAALVKDQEIAVQTVDPAAGLAATSPLWSGQGAGAGAGAGSGASAAATGTATSEGSNGTGVKLEVGIEDCLHIEFEYDKCVRADVARGRGTRRKRTAIRPHSLHPRPPSFSPPLRRTKYHLKDVVTGRVDFLLVRIKIKHMEVALIRREAAGFRA
jgi:vacuolar protein sorting-associated protein 26